MAMAYEVSDSRNVRDRPCRYGHFHEPRGRNWYCSTFQSETRTRDSYRHNIPGIGEIFPYKLQNVGIHGGVFNATLPGSRQVGVVIHLGIHGGAYTMTLPRCRPVVGSVFNVTLLWSRPVGAGRRHTWGRF